MPLGLPSQLVPQAPVGSTPANWWLLPNRQRMRGGILGVSSTQALGGTFDRFWGADSGWSQSWATNQVDWLVGLGANTVKVYGACQAINNKSAGVTTALTRVQHIANWTTLLNYIQTTYPWVYVKATMGSWPIPWGSGSLNLAGYEAECTALATLLQTYGSMIVGVDLMVEMFAYELAWNAADTTQADGNGNGSYINTNGAAIRSAVTGVTGWTAPCTFSGVAMGPSDTDTGWRANGSAVWSHISSLCDYADIHMYGSTPPYPGEVRDVFWAGNGTGVKVVIGECGANQGQTAAQETAAMQAVNQLVAMPGPAGERCAGALVWNVGSNGGNNANDWGMFTAAGVARTALTVPFQGLPG